MKELTHYPENLERGVDIEHGGEVYRVQKVEGSVVYASKLVNGKVVKGRPTRFSLVPRPE